MYFCKEHRSHKLACKQFGVIGLIIALWAIPLTRVYLLAAIHNGYIQGAIGMLILGIVARKILVWNWEAEFDDGGDAIPDPYLFNAGDGKGWGFRACMPGVIKPPWYLPLSRIFGQNKRKIGILLPDGSVSFPVFAVEWIASPAKAGSRIPVPENWCISAEQAQKMQAERDRIKSLPGLGRSEYEEDFMDFSDLFFQVNSKVGIGQPQFKEIEVIDHVTCELGENVRDLARSVDSLGTRITNHGKIFSMKVEKQSGKKK